MNFIAKKSAGLMVEFLCQGSGSPCQYKGKEMVAAHTGIRGAIVGN